MSILPVSVRIGARFSAMENDSCTSSGYFFLIACLWLDIRWEVVSTHLHFRVVFCEFAGGTWKTEKTPGVDQETAADWAASWNGIAAWAIPSAHDRKSSAGRGHTFGTWAGTPEVRAAFVSFCANRNIAMDDWPAFWAALKAVLKVSDLVNPPVFYRGVCLPC